MHYNGQASPGLLLCSCLLDCGPRLTVPRRIPGSADSARGAALLGTVRDQNGRAVPGAHGQCPWTEKDLYGNY